MNETFSVLWQAKKIRVKSKDKWILNTDFLRSIKESVLPKKYELSLVFVEDKEARKLNKIYRNKSYVPNVLSFPLDKNSGEIFINPKIAKKEAPDFDRTYEEHLASLFIHGLYHLKGYKHGSTMERAEQNTSRKFGVHALK